VALAFVSFDQIVPDPADEIRQPTVSLVTLGIGNQVRRRTAELTKHRA
jgi:hypothetical protein